MADTLSATEELIGATIGGHVRIAAVLGRGPSATVYEATDDAHGDVVVKVWDEARASDDEALLRMVRETRALSTPPHPNIATVHAAGALPDGRPYVVMQRVLGPTFAELLERGQPVAAARVADLVSGIARALDHAHRAGVVHGALHPRNVVLTISVESGEVAKVLDLGTASLHAVAPADGEDAEHVAPESRLTGSISPEADVFALAVLAFRLLTATTPSHARGAGKDAAERVALGAELDDVLARGLSEDPKQRPWPVTELLRELRAAAARSSALPTKTASVAIGPPPRTLQGVGRDGARSHDTMRDQAGSRGDRAGAGADRKASSAGAQAVSSSASRPPAPAAAPQRPAPRPPSSPSIPRPITSSLPPRPPSSSLPPRPPSSSSIRKPDVRPRPPSSPVLPAVSRPRPPSSPALPVVSPRSAIEPETEPTMVEQLPETPTVVTPPMTISSVIALPAPIVLSGPDPDPVLAMLPSAPPPSDAMRPTIPLEDLLSIEPARPMPPIAPPPSAPTQAMFGDDREPEGLAEALQAHAQPAPIGMAPSVYDDEPSEMSRPKRSGFPILAMVIGFFVVGGGITAAYFVHRSMSQSTTVVATGPTPAPTPPTSTPTPPTTDAAAPTQPTTEPTQPTQPTTEPTQQPTTAPTQPTDEPVAPTQPTTEPVAPTQPTTEPVAPTQPTTEPPDEPVAPMQPTTEPVAPTSSGPGAADIAEANRLMDSGRPRRAEPLYRRALRADPNNLDAWRGLARASERLTRRRKAIWAWEQFLRRAPNAPDAADVRARIARMQGEDPAGTAGSGGDEEPTSD